MSFIDKLFPTSRTADRLEAKAEANRIFRAGLEKGRMEGRSAASIVFGGYHTNSGEVVTEEKAVSITALYNAVKILANTSASLPLKLYRRREDGGREEAREHPLYRVLSREPNPLMSAFKCRQAMMIHCLLWGNSYSELVTNSAGDVVEIWPINPRRVEIKRRGERIVYRVWLPGGGYDDLPQRKVLHISNLGFDGVEGKSPITLFRETLGITMSAERYGGTFFKNNATGGLVLKHPNRLSPDAHSNLKRDVQEQHGGANAWRPWILEEGMDISSVGLPPGDAQFLETRQFGVLEIARIFDLPPHKLKELERATFSNIEEQSLEFVTQSLRDWLVNIEQECNRRLLTEPEKESLYVEHIVEGLLRGDIESRYNAYAVARNWGWMSADDIRKLENLNPLPDGKGQVYLQPMNMVAAGDPPPAAPTRGSGVMPEVRAQEVRALPPRYRLSIRLLPMMKSVIGRANRREIAELRKAVEAYLVTGRVDEFRAFLESFQEEHSEWLMTRGQILGMFETIAGQMVEAARDEIGADVEPDEEFTRDYAEAYANRHVGSTAGQLEALLEEDDPEAAVRHRLDEWEGTGETPSRADKESDRERVRASNAFTKAAWALAGVSTIIWRNTGSSTCPMCNHLDGRAVSITQFFVREGEEVPNEGGTNIVVKRNTGHPPLHRGCDCLILPGIGRSTLTEREIRAVKDSILNECKYDIR